MYRLRFYIPAKEGEAEDRPGVREVYEALRATGDGPAYLAVKAALTRLLEDPGAAWARQHLFDTGAHPRGNAWMIRVLIPGADEFWLIWLYSADEDDVLDLLAIEHAPGTYRRPAWSSDAG
jgi:hypothetical protein